MAKDRKFIDTAIMHAYAGKGGDGSASFRREKFVPRGGPDGGDGGRGGHVIVQGSAEVDSLIGIYYAPHRRAGHGGNGLGKQCHGKNGDDVIVEVPLGTELWNAETGDLIGDIVTDGQPLTVAHGGRGGRGNVHWKSSTNRAPREHTDGKPGEMTELRLELKIVADVGLVGFPNAGKSSLLTALSDAHPKIGAYPFTTLNPIIGTMIFEDYSRIKVADIPGLIKGAHEGVGLGHDFLRHIERSRFLIYVIDMAGTDVREPHQDYLSLREELRLHQEGLADRPALVVANKMDNPDSAELLETFIRETGEEPLKVSATTGLGIDILREAIAALTADARMPEPLYAITLAFPTGRTEPIDAAFLEQDIACNTWQLEGASTVQYTCYAATHDEANEQARRIAGIIDAAGLPQLEISVSDISGTDWEQAWKQFFKAECISEHILVCPTWESVDAPDGVHIIEIDPGMSFGTGLHPTTRSCIRFLDALWGEGRRGSLLDVGCGSGILTIAAGKLGFTPLTAVDIDPQAVTDTTQNLARTDIVAAVSEGSTETLPTTTYRIVVANILAPILQQGRDALAVCVEPDGVLILSGILDVQFAGIQKHYEAAGLTLRDTILDGDWRSGIWQG